MHRYSTTGFAHFQPSGTGSIGNYMNYVSKNDASIREREREREREKERKREREREREYVHERVDTEVHPQMTTLVRYG